MKIWTTLGSRGLKLAQRPQAEPTPWISVFGDDFLRVRFVLILEIPNEIWSTKTPTEIVKCWTWHFILHVQRCTQSYRYRHNAREAYLYQRASWVGFVSGRGFELACGQDVLYNSSDGSLHYPTVKDGKSSWPNERVESVSSRLSLLGESWLVDKTTCCITVQIGAYIIQR